MDHLSKISQSKDHLPSVLVITGDGLNSEIETKKAFDLAGGEGKVIHINDLCAKPEILSYYHILAIPGGFSYGDHLGSGKILSLKIKNNLMGEFKKFINAKKPIIGICNGFQVLMQLGLLPYPHFRTHTLTHNREKKFINRWVGLDVNSESPCIWTNQLKDQSSFDLPIRHGEGAVIGEKKIPENLIPLKYSYDINGSMQNIAGLCDESGLIFGLMPHPEIFLYQSQHPDQGQKRGSHEIEGYGLRIFKSAIDYVKSI